MEKPDLGRLLEPMRLGALELRNRFVLPGMQRRWSVEGAPDARLDAYYCRRVEGGVGLIISEALAVDHASATQTPSFSRLTPATAAAWKRCVGAVKDVGGTMLLQLWHEGAIRPEGGDNSWSVHPTLSPSGIAYRHRANGRAATGAELAAIRDAFIRSALLARDAGADGIEVHAAHGYLLDQFLWSVTNRRDDGYGGADMRDRARFPAEIVAGVRQACGKDFLISFRFSQWKEADFDARVAETQAELATLTCAVRDAGADVLHASTRRFWEPEWPGSDLNLAGWAKRLSGLPVITVGSVGLSADVTANFTGEHVAATIERAVLELGRRADRNEFDLVAIGRSLIADPDWINKVRDGKYATVRAFSRSDLRLPDHLMGLGREAHREPRR